MKTLIRETRKEFIRNAELDDLKNELNRINQSIKIDWILTKKQDIDDLRYRKELLKRIVELDNLEIIKLRIETFKN